MSLLLKIYNTERLLIKNGILNIGRYYSRRSKSNNPYKIVGGNNIEDKLYDECGPNWELFNPTFNRFHLPGKLGAAWQCKSSVYDGDVRLKELVDFNSKDSNKLHFSVRKCPILLLKDLDELFLLNGMRKENTFTVITLHYPKQTEVEHSAKNFVIAAREICTCLQTDNYWADFINPFNGLPFFESRREKCFTNDEGFRRLGTKFESINNCLVIKSDTNGTFGGNIFTDGPNDIDKIQRHFSLMDYDSDE